MCESQLSLTRELDPMVLQPSDLVKLGQGLQWGQWFHSKARGHWEKQKQYPSDSDNRVKPRGKKWRNLRINEVCL